MDVSLGVVVIALAQGDAVRIPLRDESVHVCVTSPPYWGLRSYSGDQARVWGGSAECQHAWEEENIRQSEQWEHGPNRMNDSKTGARNPRRDGAVKKVEVSQGQFCQLCGAWYGALGLEPDPSLYVQHIVEIFREIRRVLRNDGTVWAVWGDSYQDKQLQGIPWRCALALQRDGWWLRDAIIWIKAEVNTDEIPMFDMPVENVLEGSAMPGSQKDRCTSSYEFIFHLAKSKMYYFDQEAEKTTSGATLRNTWRMNPQNYKGAHFATFCEELPRRCIKLGTSEHGCCPVCGKGWRRVTKCRQLPSARMDYEGKCDGLDEQHNLRRLRMLTKTCRAAGMDHDHPNFAPTTVGWRPSCNCYGEPMPCPDCGGTGAQIVNTGLMPEHGNLEQWSCDRCNGKGDVWPDDVEDWPTVPAIVLDPFVGSGTSLLAARKLGRSAIGLDLSLNYLRDQARKRLSLSALDDWYSTDAQDGEGENLDELPLFAVNEEVQ